nr:reverse transcriptase domain-containing protein [Tanacetum cinerariifolium]
MSGNEDHHRQGRRFAAGGNGHDGRDPRDVEIERLRQRVRELEVNGSADRGNEKVNRDPWNISEIKGLRRRVRDLETQHEIRQIRKRIRELEFLREMRKETESRYVVRDDVNEEEETENANSIQGLKMQNKLSTEKEKFMIVVGAENRPPMLEKTIYNSWQSRMLLYLKGKKHGRMMLESIENGPLVYPIIEENGTIRPKKYAEIFEQEKLQDDWSLFNKFKEDMVKVLLVRELKEMLQVQIETIHLIDDLDAYDSDCDDISSAKAILMANLSSYDSEVLHEEPYSDTYQHEEHADILREIVKNARALSPLDSNLDFADYSKPSHKDYRNAIELLEGNNAVPLRSDTIRLVQNGCSFHGIRSEDPNQHLKDFLKFVDSLDLDVANRERTRQRLFRFSLRD